MSACPTYICFITHGLVTGGDSLVFLAAVAAFGSDSQVCCCFVFLSCNGLPGTCGSCLCFCTPLQFSLSFSVHKNIMLISRQTAVSNFFFFFSLGIQYLSLIRGKFLLQRVLSFKLRHMQRHFRQNWLLSCIHYSRGKVFSFSLLSPFSCKPQHCTTMSFGVSVTNTHSMLFRCWSQRLTVTDSRRTTGKGVVCMCEKTFKAQDACAALKAAKV